MYKSKFRKDISFNPNSIGHILSANRDSLFETKSLGQLQQLVKKILSESTAPKARQVEFKLSRQKSLADAFIYLQNVMFASAGLATY